MHLQFFLLLLSSGASSYLLPLKETVYLQKKAKSGIIDEMLCLLKAENDSINMQFFKPLHIKNQRCAHENTKNFIKELQKIPKCKCMKIVEKDMRKLQNNCPILRKPSAHNHKCSEVVGTNFSRFKKSLEEFLKWVNEEQECGNTGTSDLGLYQDGKCSCPKFGNTTRFCTREKPPRQLGREGAQEEKWLL